MAHEYTYNKVAYFGIKNGRLRYARSTVGTYVS